MSPELEVVPEEITFHTEDVTSPEAVQYEAPTEVLAVEIPSVQLTSAEMTAIERDIQKFKRVLEINPNNAFGWDTIGGLYKSIGQYSEAALAYQKAAALEPNKACYFHHLGLVFAAEGRYEDAIAAFQKVIEIDPNYSLAHATLGGYYRKKGMEELAQAHIEKAKSLLGADENEYNRACMEAICGNSDRALELLEIALKNKQTYVNWAKRDPDLDFIRSDPRFHALLSEHATRPAH
jgi:tetratricopeptide (TPR) repeat protein